jgi:hypothetical protein
VNVLKAVSSGIAALIVAALVLATPLLAVMVKYGAALSPPVTDGFYVVIHWHVWTTACASLLVFAAGFFWQYRRTRQFHSSRE